MDAWVDASLLEPERWARERRRVDARFEAVPAAGRDALRKLLSTRNVGQIRAEHDVLLKALPIFRVHGGGSGAGGGISRRDAPRYTSVSGAERLLLAPRPCDSALLGPEFALERSADDTELLQTLGVERVGKAVFYREHVLPRAVARALPAGECSAR